MSERPTVVRSYQRVFAPDRRIYAIDGRTLPIPGGLPLRWLAGFSIALLGVLALSARSAPVIIVATAATGAWVARRGRRLALPAAGIAALVYVLAGVLLGVLDWPLRLLMVPAVVATAATQLSSDGRAPHRFVRSWLDVRLSGRRRLGQSLASRAERRERRWRVRVAHDAHGPVLHRARITGPAVLRLAAPARVCRRRRRWLVRPLDSRARRGGVMLDALEVAAGEHAEIRP